MRNAFLSPDKLMEETEELSHQRAQREVRPSFTRLVSSHNKQHVFNFYGHKIFLNHLNIHELYMLQLTIIFIYSFFFIIIKLCCYAIVVLDQ